MGAVAESEIVLEAVRVITQGDNGILNLAAKTNELSILKKFEKVESTR